jgi:predicted extracellular nuclease
MLTSRSTHRRLGTLGLIAALAASLLPPGVVLADTTAQALPFAQAWTNTNLITLGDDWSGVPGIEGHLGQNITTATGTDPQTLLTDSPEAADVDVIPNQLNAGLTTGGVAEFHFADPVVALQGSGTADAPYVLISLNTTGFTGITVAYNLRDIDGSTDNAIQPAALQFRVGGTGTFTNVPAGFVADATSGPSLATLVTSVSAALPAGAENQSLVQLRVITANAVGSDEWVGVDDIAITGLAGDAGPSVTATDPADGASNVALDTNISVTFSEAVDALGAFDISCNVSGTHAATVSGGPITFSIDPVVDFVDDETCTLTVLAASVTDQDTNDPPDGMTVDHVTTFTPGTDCGETATAISAIQGSGSSAALTGIQTVEGVVVGDFEGTTGLSGFYLQDGGDADPATSDGIFVFTGSANTVAAGDQVRVTGYARERFNQTALNGSNSNSDPVAADNITLCGSGNVEPTDVTLPFATLTYPERFEGMLVNLPQALVISEYFNYERFGELVLAQPLDGEDRAFTPTSIVEPGAPAIARALANSLSRITLDDGLSTQNPVSIRHPNGDPFSLTNRFRGGDTVANTVGVMGFDFGVYRIQPTGAAKYTSTNPRPPEPDPVGGTLRVAAMNTLNFFLTPDYPNTTTPNPLDNVCGGNANLECRGADADQPLEFTRQRDKLLAALAGLDADIIGLNEIENTPDVEPLLDPTIGVVAGLNAMADVGPYDAIDTGVIGTDAIRVGLIYRTDRVAPVGDFKILNRAVDPRFIDTKSRPVLAQTFEDLATGARFTVAVNHLKSKGSDCLDVDDPDLGDGQGNCNLTRKAAAEALVDWLAADPTGSGDRDYLILGDLNSYAQEDPIDAIRAGADDEPNTADDYTNLIAKYQGTYAHSYVFDGQAGYLDHALASPTLVGQVTGAADWHINSDEPDLLDYDTTFKPDAQDAIYEPNAYRSSDHDPVVVGLNLLNYEFSGFLSPVDNPPVVNTVNAGRTIPMKFTLSGDLGLDVLFGTPTSTAYSCESGLPTDEVETTASAGNEGLTLDPATGQYTYAWNTHKPWANQCRTFELTFDDGAFRTADFRFR